MTSHLVARYKEVTTIRDVANTRPNLPRGASSIVTRFKLAVIRKEKGQYCVKSPNNPNWEGGCYPTEEAAKKRLDQVEWFKNK